MKTKLVLVKVEQKHIDNAKRDDGYSCPIALACNDLNLVDSDNKDVTAFVQGNRVWKVGSTVGYKLPLFAKAFVQAFDSRRKVEPFEFEIDLNQPKFR